MEECQNSPEALWKEVKAGQNSPEAHVNEGRRKTFLQQNSPEALQWHTEYLEQLWAKR